MKCVFPLNELFSSANIFILVGAWGAFTFTEPFETQDFDKKQTFETRSRET